jgi:predicted TIM-barrel fold metal-dependent hydrolase
MDPAALHAMIRDAIDLFDVSRCMFGSNFPVDRLFSSDGALWDGFIAATAGLSAADIERL